MESGITNAQSADRGKSFSSLRFSGFSPHRFHQQPAYVVERARGRHFRPLKTGCEHCTDIFSRLEEPLCRLSGVSVLQFEWVDRWFDRKSTVVPSRLARLDSIGSMSSTSSGVDRRTSSLTMRLMQLKKLGVSSVNPRRSSVAALHAHHDWHFRRGWFFWADWAWIRSTCCWTAQSPLEIRPPSRDIPFLLVGPGAVCWN